jgi:hypothetical protein
MFFQQPRASGRRIMKTYDYFEPSITAASGSLQLFVHPCEPMQLPLYVHPDEPLRLWIQVLDAARRGAVSSITGPLLERIFSVDELLRQVHKFVEVGIRYGDLRVNAPGLESEIVVAREVGDAIQASINALETRNLSRDGVLYALDLVRRWFRILVEEGGEQEDWTIRFDDQWKEQVSGTVPRQVVVEFATQTRPEMKRGTGNLISIRGESEQLTGTIHSPSVHATRS